MITAREQGVRSNGRVHGPSSWAVITSSTCTCTELKKTLQHFAPVNLWHHGSLQTVYCILLYCNKNTKYSIWDVNLQNVKGHGANRKSIKSFLSNFHRVQHRISHRFRDILADTFRIPPKQSHLLGLYSLKAYIVNIGRWLRPVERPTRFVLSDWMTEWQAEKPIL